MLGSDALTVGIFAALLALFLGPSVYQAASGYRVLRLALRWFLILAILGLILLDVLPHTFEQAGWVVVPLALVGAGGPTFIEKGFRSVARQAHNLALHLGMLSLFLHGLADGAALQLSGPDEFALPAAIVLHQFPVGMTIWWLTKGAWGRTTGVLALSVAAVLTVLGAVLAEPIESLLTGRTSAAFQALVAGTLMHVVLHRPGSEEGGHEPRHE